MASAEIIGEPGIWKKMIDHRKIREELGRQERAQKLVDDLRVKQHVFLPSKRTLWTVVGREGDMMVNFGGNSKELPYCSCNDFHFRVLGGEIPECYHLMAAKQALGQKKYAVTNFSDDEYEFFLRSLILDLFSRV